MLNNKIYKRINEVENQRDFSELMLIFQMSDAKDSTKEEAMDKLKKNFPEYCDVLKRNESIMRDIEAGQADISDMN